MQTWPTPDAAVDAAIARGHTMGLALIALRSALIGLMQALLPITGVTGLRACVAGALEVAIKTPASVGEGPLLEVFADHERTQPQEQGQR